MIKNNETLTPLCDPLILSLKLFELLLFYCTSISYLSLLYSSKILDNR